jgi:hypothetical protein
MLYLLVLVTGNKKPLANYCKRLKVIWLSCQGSNLDSSDPESDVLPITPQDNSDAKLINFVPESIEVRRCFFQF